MWPFSKKTKLADALEQQEHSAGTAAKSAVREEVPNEEERPSAPQLPLRLERGFRPQHPEAPIDPKTGVKFRQPAALFADHWSVHMSGRYYLFESVSDLLVDVYFRAGTTVLDFNSHDIGGNLPKFRVLVCFASIPGHADAWEKFFIGRYTDSLVEAAQFVRQYRSVKIEDVAEQGFGVHRYNPRSNSYEFDSDSWRTIGDLAEGGTTLNTEDRVVFISSTSRDYPIATQAYSTLTANGRQAFCAPISLPESKSTEFSTEIDKALERSQHLIVIASSQHCFESPWFDQEWRTWINEKRSGRKVGNVLVLLGSDMPIPALPIALRPFECRPHSEFKSNVVTSYF